ncbi:MAG: SycD/LcrH family type III secretion system chaperone [Parachlamydiaceae bacterium]|nr:SycD/LcrH family type III secretion system chaperone [Parachlamydiaceae bacterium]
MAKTPQEEVIDKQVEKVGGNYPPKAKDQLKSVFTDIIEKGMTIMEAIHFPPPLVELIYSHASELYTAGKFQDASKLFYYLVRLNPKDPRFSFAYAASLHKLKNYEEAAGFYLMSTTIDSENPLPWFHSGDCYLELQKPDVALIMLAKSIEVAGNSPNHERLKQQAGALCDAIKQSLGGGA